MADISEEKSDISEPNAAVAAPANTGAPKYLPARRTAAVKSAFSNALETKPVWTILILSALLTLVIEMLGRRSVNAGLWFLLSSPHIFAADVLIVCSTLLLCLLGKKRAFWLAFIATIWFGLGVAECIVLGYRTTPISAVDFSLLISTLPIITYYFSIPEIIFICAAIVGVITLLVFMGIRCRKIAQPKLTRRLGTLATVAAITLTTLFVGRWTGFLGAKFINIGSAYKEYGFPYCFCLSIFDRGIGKPAEYSPELVDSIVSGLDEQPSEDTGIPEVEEEPVKPNIVFLQLESFFDVERLKDATFSAQPLPNFSKLKADCPSGFLTVPTIGAGTANVEFEVLTGMSLGFFGAGEYPYKTVLMSKTCESLPYNLGSYGYSSTAIHNNTATFYDRDHVYRNLGFDRFVSLEYMLGLTYTPVGWARDEVLTGQIFDALDSTDTPDFLFAISVQGHGKYPTEVADELEIDVSGVYEDEPVTFEYFVNQLHEDDIFLGELTGKLAEYPEPVMLVIYGDHLPSFEITDELLESGSCFQTEYAIWTNYPLEAEDEDLYAYQLSAHIMELCGYDEGYLTRLHCQRRDDDDYMEKLEVLEYDMLYGNMDVFDGVNPHLPTDIRFGLDNIRITDAKLIDGDLYISGQNFTEYSTIYDGEDAYDTVYINDHAIMCREYGGEDGAVLTVRQVCDDHTVLSTSNIWLYSTE